MPANYLAKRREAEITFYQRSTSLNISKQAFCRVVREISHDKLNLLELRWKSEALGALQHASELFLVDLFCMAQAAAVHAHRSTVMISDMNFIYQLQSYGTFDVLRGKGIQNSIQAYDRKAEQVAAARAMKAKK